MLLIGIMYTCTRVSWGRTGWGIIVGRWVDWFGRFVPLRLFGVNVDVEPDVVSLGGQDVKCQRVEHVPFFVLFIPLSFPSATKVRCHHLFSTWIRGLPLWDSWRWRTTWRYEVAHRDLPCLVIVFCEYVVDVE